MNHVIGEIDQNGNVIPVSQSPFENAINTGRMVHQTLNGLSDVITTVKQSETIPALFALGALGLFLYTKSQKGK
jgi:hypothetical protein